MKLTDLENRVRQVAWPAPPENLRARVLSQASVGNRTIAWSDRLWFSRAWRLGMVAATIVLLAIQMLPGPWGTSSLAPSPQALAEARVIEDTGRQIGLPTELIASLARRALAEARPRATDLHAWAALQGFDDKGGRR